VFKLKQHKGDDNGRAIVRDFPIFCSPGKKSLNWQAKTGMLTGMTSQGDK
jgi:hypothetical protein